MSHLCVSRVCYRGDHGVSTCLCTLLGTSCEDERRDETRRDETRLYKTRSYKTRHERREGERTRIEPLVVPYLGIDP